MAEASATAEPEMPANSIEERMFTCARPPRTWPISDWLKLTIERVMPPEFMSSPARMKNGTASSGKLSTPL
jgi:hypothetical protein